MDQVKWHYGPNLVRRPEFDPYAFAENPLFLTLAVLF